MADAANITGEKLVELIRKSSPFVREQINNALGRATNVTKPSGKSTKYSPVADIGKTTEDTLRSLTTHVSQMISKAGAQATLVEKQFGSNFTSSLIKRAQSFSNTTKDMKRAESELVGSKLMSQLFETLSSSRAGTLEDFKRYNPEFETTSSLTEQIVNNLRNQGQQVTKNSKIVKELVRNYQDVVDAAFQLNAATGETNLQGVLSQTEKIPVSKSMGKATSDTVSSLENIVIKAINNLGSTAKLIENQLSSNITNKLLTKAKASESKGKYEESTKYLEGAKLASAKLELMAGSTAKTFAEFKKLNPEFENAQSFAESIAEDLAKVGVNVSSTTPWVKKLADEFIKTGDAAFRINKATGETNLQGLIAQTKIEPVSATSGPATEETFASIDSLITKIIKNLGASTKVLENQFGQNLTTQMLAAAEQSAGKGDLEFATQQAYLAKFAATSMEAMAGSSAKNLAEFKKLNPEFESVSALAEALSIKMAQAGESMSADHPELVKAAENMKKIADNAFAVNKATGETNLSGIIAQTEDIAKKQAEWNKLLVLLPDGYDKIKEALVSPAASIAAIGVVLLSKFNDAWEAAKNVKEQLGASIPQTVRLSGEMAKASTQTAKWAASAKDLGDATIALANYSGDISMANADAITNVSKMTTLTGISADNAVKLNVIFKQMGNGSQKVADNITTGAINFARINNIAPQKLMNELATNTDKFAGLTKEGVKNMIAATAMAMKLNVEFSKLVQTGESFLDVQNLIQTSMETNALLGTNFDLTDAAAKYNANDMKGFVNDLTSQLQGLDFSKMTRIEKNQITKMLGGQFTIDEIQNIIKNADELKKMPGEISEAMMRDLGKNKEIKDGWLDTLYGWAKPEYLLVAISGANLLLGSFSKLKAGMSWMWNAGLTNKIKGFFGAAQSVAAPAPRIQPRDAMGRFTSRQSPVPQVNNLSKINYGNMLKGAGAIAIMSVALIGLATAMLIFSKNDRLLESFAAATAGIVMLTGATVTMGKLLGTGIAWKTLISGAAAMVIMSGALGVLGYALQQFNGIDFTTLAVAATALVGLTGAIMGLGSMALNPFTLSLLLAGSAVLLGLSIVLAGFGKALQSVAEPIKTLSASFATLIPNMRGLAEIVPLTKSLVTSLSNLGKELKSGILASSLQAIANPVKVVSDSFSSLTLSVKALVELIPSLYEIGNAFNSLGKQLSSGTLSSGLQLLVSPIKTISDSFISLATNIKELTGISTLLNTIGSSISSFSFGLQPISVQFNKIGPVLNNIANVFGILDRSTQNLSNTFPKLSAGILQLTPAITALSALNLSMIKIGDGFSAMAKGVNSLITSITTISPLLPILGSLTNIGNAPESTSSPTKSVEESQLSRIADDMEQIKDFITKGGAAIYIDGRKVGNWLGKSTSNWNALENR